VEPQNQHESFLGIFTRNRLADMRFLVPYQGLAHSVHWAVGSQECLGAHLGAAAAVVLVVDEEALAGMASVVQGGGSNGG
jgi:hypothetical protein